MTTIIESTDSGSSAVGLILGILLALALVVGGVYFYNSGAMSGSTTNNTTILPAPSAPAPAAPNINITTPAPAAPAAPAETAPAQ